MQGRGASTFIQCPSSSVSRCDFFFVVYCGENGTSEHEEPGSREEVPRSPGQGEGGGKSESPAGQPQGNPGASRNSAIKQIIKPQGKMKDSFLYFFNKKFMFQWKSKSNFVRI